MKIDDWDVNLWQYTRYVYYTPLCYQLITETENSKHWGDHNPLLYLGCVVASSMFKLIQLDTSTTAYSFIYFMSKVWIWIFSFYA